jgi:hypothetical protein
MATDGRKRETVSVWERLEAERALKGGLPFDTQAGGAEAMPAKPSDEEQRAQWAADLAAVAEQRRAEPPRPSQTSSSVNPLEWELPSGAAEAEARAKAAQRAPPPAEVREAWAEQLAEQGPRHARRSGDFHNRMDVHSGVHGFAGDAPALARQEQASVRRDPGQSTAPFGLETDNPAHAKTTQPLQAVAQDREAVQAQWQQTLDAVHSDQPRFARKTSDMHVPPPPSGHASLLAPDGAVKAKPQRSASSNANQTKSKDEVMQSLVEQQQQLQQQQQPPNAPAVTTGAKDVASAPVRRMSRSRLNALAAPKHMYSPREGDAASRGSSSSSRRGSSAGDSVASSAARSARLSMSGSSSSISSRRRQQQQLQPSKEAWKAVAGAARESLGPEAWGVMSRAEKKSFLRTAIAEEQQLLSPPPQSDPAQEGGGGRSLGGAGPMDLDDSQSFASNSQSAWSGSTAATAATTRSQSQRRSRASNSTAESRSGSTGHRRHGGGGGGGGSGSVGPVEAGAGADAGAGAILDAHATTQWHISDQYSDSQLSSGNQPDRFVSATRGASMLATQHQTAAAAENDDTGSGTRRAQSARITDVHAVSNWHFAEQFVGSADGHQDDRFVTSTRASLHVQPSSGGGGGGGGGPQQAVVTTAALQSTAFSLG